MKKVSISLEKFFVVGLDILQLEFIIFARRSINFIEDVVSPYEEILFVLFGIISDYNINGILSQL